MSDERKDPPKLTQPGTLKIPPGIETAALLGRLTFFIGNGISRLYGLPAWDELANEMLKRLANHGIINHDTMGLLSRHSTKIKISIADGHFKKNLETRRYSDLTYESILTRGLTKEKMQSEPVYGAIAKCRVKFITTNYDQILVNFLEGLNAEAEPVQSSNLGNENELVTKVEKPTTKKVQIFNKMSEINRSAILNNNVVFQIHGSIADERSIIASTESYLDLYGNPDTREALELLFENQTVVFIGYGLEEMELLDLIVRASKPKNPAKATTKFYLLLPLLTHETAVLEHLKIYFQQLGIEVLDFCCDERGYNALGEVLETWADRLPKISKEPTLVDATNLVDKLLSELDEISNEK
jgi:hypothetical protein